MSEALHNHAALMDGIYRRQRHFYDATRKYYLLGRDHLIDELRVPNGGTVLEIGCGTGRNLAMVARRYPSAQLFGVDISAQMLDTAKANFQKAGLGGQANFGRGDATALDPEGLFGISQFDRVFISYALSMIPGWEAAVAQAASVVAPGGSLHVVDFGQQDELPRWFRAALHAWLRRFHVAPRADLGPVMESTAANLGASSAVTPMYRDYARYGVIRMPVS